MTGIAKAEKVMTASGLQYEDQVVGKGAEAKDSTLSWVVRKVQSSGPLMRVATALRYRS